MDILTNTTKRVLHIVLNRPNKCNALTAAMCLEIVNRVESAQTDPQVGSILISANGSVFCVGIDQDEIVPDGRDLDPLYEALFSLNIRSSKPIVVGVNGAALGGGLGLVAQGDVVMASDKAVFGLPEVRIGLFPFFVYRSVEVAIGHRRTLQASLTGHLFHPDNALEWGLVHRVCPSIELDDRVKVMARELARASPTATAAGLEYVRRSRGLSWEEAGKLATELRARVTGGADFAEGVAAFKAKREPRWPSMPPEFYESN